MNEEKVNEAFDKAYAEWTKKPMQKTPEDEEFEMIERQLLGWRKRQIVQKMDSIEKYDSSKIFIQAGWYSKEQLENLLIKVKEQK